MARPARRTAIAAHATASPLEDEIVSPHDFDQERAKSWVIEASNRASRADERRSGAFIEDDGRLVVVGVAIDKAIDRVKINPILVEVPRPRLRQAMFAL